MAVMRYREALNEALREEMERDESVILMGEDITLVGISRMAVTAEKAAKVLADEHEISAEVIDPRTLRPLDLDTILASVHKTNRCVIVEEGWPHGGVGANLSALITEQAFDDLDAPVERVTGVPAPMPYAKNLEVLKTPSRAKIAAAIRKACNA